MGSLEPLATLRGVTHLGLSIRKVWPDLAPLSRMPTLEELTCRVNILALAGVPALPCVRVANFHADFHWRVPLRSLRDLPEMPNLERMIVESVDDLAGIERNAVATRLQHAGQRDHRVEVSGAHHAREEDFHAASLSPTGRSEALVLADADDRVVIVW